MPTTPSKTAGTSVVAWQEVATQNRYISAEQDVSTKWAASFAVRLGRKTSTAFTAGWPNVRIDGCANASGGAGNHWIPLWTYQMAVGSGTIAANYVNSAASAGDTNLVLQSTTNFAAGNLIFVGYNADATKYELARILVVTNGTTLALEDALANAHVNNSLSYVTHQAEQVFPVLDLSAISRVRVVIDNAGGGQSVFAEVIMTTFDSF